MTSAEQSNQMAIAIINRKATQGEIDSILLRFPSFYQQVDPTLQPVFLQALARVAPPLTCSFSGSDSILSSAVSNSPTPSNSKPVES